MIRAGVCASVSVPVDVGVVSRAADRKLPNGTFSNQTEDPEFRFKDGGVPIINCYKLFSFACSVQ